MSYKQLFYKLYLNKSPGNLKQYSANPFETLIPMYERYYGRFLPSDKKAKIVDIGCGTGSFVWWLQKKGFQNILGIDISSEMIKFGKQAMVGNLIEGDFREHLLSKQEEYDFVAAHDVLEHFPKDEIIRILKLIYSSLKEGGILLLSVPNANSPFCGEVRYGDFTHEISFTPHSLSKILSLCGFKNIVNGNVKVYPKEPVVHGLKSALRWFFWRIIQTFLKFYWLVEKGTVDDGIFTRVMYAVCKKSVGQV